MNANSEMANDHQNEWANATATAWSWLMFA